MHQRIEWERTWFMRQKALASLYSTTSHDRSQLEGTADMHSADPHSTSPSCYGELGKSGNFPETFRPSIARDRSLTLAVQFQEPICMTPSQDSDCWEQGKQEEQQQQNFQESQQLQHLSQQQQEEHERMDIRRIPAQTTCLDAQSADPDPPVGVLDNLEALPKFMLKKIRNVFGVFRGDHRHRQHGEEIAETSNLLMDMEAYRESQETEIKGSPMPLH